MPLIPPSSESDRAVSEVIGTILIFGLLVLTLTLFQTLGVPAANHEVEFKHNLDVQQDMRNVFGVIAQTGADSSASVEVTTGARYPSRFVLLNPPDPAGRLTTQDRAGNVILSNVTADGETGDYLDGSAHQFSTKAVVYTPQYNEYRNAPETIIAPGVLYNRFEDSDIVLAAGLINERTVTLFVVNGSLVEDGYSSSIGINTLSGPARTVSVTNSDNGPITLTIPTRMNASMWEDDVLANKQYVEAVTPVPNADQVNITLTAGETYDLRMVMVGVGRGQTEPNATYITDVDGDNSTLAEATRRTVTFQVRDRFNNPVSGESVHVGVDKGAILADDEHQGYEAEDTVEYTTDENGMVTVVYRAPATITNPSEADIRASMAFDDLAGSDPAWSSSKENATISIRLLNSTEQDQSQPLFNPFTGVVIDSAVITDECPSPDSKCEVEVTFRNNGSEEKQITDIRYVFHGGDSQGQAAGDPNDVARVWDGNETTSPKLELGEEYESVESFGFTMGPGETTTVELRFYENNAGTDEREIRPEEWFVLDVLLDDERRETYFVDPGD